MPTPVQTKGVNSTSLVASQTVTFGSNMTAGNTVIIGAGVEAGTAGISFGTPTCTDLSGITSKITQSDTTTDAVCELWIATVATTGAAGIVVTPSTSARGTAFAIELPGTWTFDTNSTSTNGSSTDAAGGSVTPAEAGEFFVICACVHSAAAAITAFDGNSGSYTLPTSLSFSLTAGAGGYFLNSGSTAQNGGFTLSPTETWGAINAAFKPPGGGNQPSVMVV
jgi:hypothetical protein